MFGSKIQRQKCENKLFPVNILSSFLSDAEVVSNLDVWLRPVWGTCKDCFDQRRDLKLCRWYLTNDTALLTASVLVGSKIDYCV